MSETPRFKVGSNEVGIRVYVQPRTTSSGITVQTERRLQPAYTAIPADSMANPQAAEALAGIFVVQQSGVRLRKGPAARDQAAVIRCPGGRCNSGDPGSLLACVAGL